MPERPWLLLPVKSLAHGKSRLCTALNERARRALNEFFLRRMLALAADFPGLENTAVVSDAADALSLATELGARALRCEQAGLNAAISFGKRRLQRSGAGKLLIMPTDLPLVRLADLLEIAALSECHEAILCPDRDFAGTNALVLSSYLPMQFRFGENSYQRHCAAARRCGVVPLTHFNKRIAQDVDTPEHLTALLGMKEEPLRFGPAILSAMRAATRVCSNRNAAGDLPPAANLHQR
jgi:2-phospho-L-lactate/phosphoenolpyruvate guanylyltransferase